MPDLDVIGAQVLGPAGLHRDGVTVAGGVIGDARGGRTVDLSGYLVLPGIVDIHGDGFERHLAPRRGAMKQMADGLVATDSEVAANGITTAVLAQFVSWEGGLRGLDFADRVFAAIREAAPDLVTDMRAQVRFETNLLEHYDSLPARLADWGVDYVVFNDHLPHDRLAERRKPQGLVGQALKAGRNPEAHFEHLLKLHAAHDKVPAALDRLCRVLQPTGVRLGSHDDVDGAARERWRARGVRIAVSVPYRARARARASPELW